MTEEEILRQVQQARKTFEKLSKHLDILNKDKIAINISVLIKLLAVLSIHIQDSEEFLDQCNLKLRECVLKVEQEMAERDS